jgi:Ca2+-binding RTX toxin-like protein
MTTYTFSGAAVRYSLQTGEVELFGSYDMPLRIVAPDGTTGFSYTYKPGDQGYLNPVSLDLDAWNVELDYNMPGVEIELTGVQIYGTSWIDAHSEAKSGTVMKLTVTAKDDYYLGYSKIEYFFGLEGDQPDFSTLEQVLELTQPGGFTFAPDASVAPGQVIPFATLNPRSVSEHDHITGTNQGETIYGGKGNDVIFAKGGKDVLYGGAGNDLLAGGRGADLLHGGSGNDMATYADVRGNLTADLAYSQLNTMDAAGDTYLSIENLSGNYFSNDLRGNDKDNIIVGMGGWDTLHGRGGNDRLFGDDGNDVLLGGSGADRLDGGPGTDRAQYHTSDHGVRVDMAYGGRNTGDAAGDTLISIENLAGSHHRDVLAGDAWSNRLLGLDGNDRLTGRGGDDRLSGRGGNDRLEGEDGRDILNGGNGNDLLIGGNDRDIFIFNQGADIIRDFGNGNDRLRLDDKLWNGTLTKAQVLAFASQDGTNTTFDFGNGNTLVLENYTDIAGLE